MIASYKSQASTHRLTASEAHSYVTLESYIVAAGELERVKASH